MHDHAASDGALLPCALTVRAIAPRFASSPVSHGAHPCSNGALAGLNRQLVNVAPPARRAREESR